MKNKKLTVHKPEAILTELRALVSDAEKMVDHTSDDVMSSLHARYEAAQERLLDAYSDAKRKAVAGAAYADEAIRERPYWSLAIAAGAGLALGLLVALRKSRYAASLITMLAVTMGGMSLSAQRAQDMRYPQGGQMSGTYELETTRGDNAQQVADMATRNLPQGQRDRAYQDLLNRLQAPQSMAIERNGRTFTISSSNGPRASFDADGRTRNESLGNRRVTATRAVLNGDRLIVTSRGNRNTDFQVTFESVDGGNGLLVTRQMDRDDLRKPAVIRSYYRRVAPEPRWDVYRADPRTDPRDYGRDVPTAFIVPDGTRMLAILDTPISTRTSRDGERFTMTVQGPGEYRDARIDGVIQRVTPYGNGRNAEMRVDFDTIRLRNGQTAQFEGVLTNVRTPNGTTLRVSSENVPNNSAEKTIQGGAVGAALGAIIGAIAGGGKGAAIGAVVGGAGGAVMAQDREQYLDLPPGTEVTLVVTSSRRNR